MLRNVIERIFGILKRRFKILKTASEYTMEIQVRLVYALTALHNYIQQEAEIEGLETGLEAETEDEEGSEEPDVPVGSIASPISREMDTKRDEIALEMWEAYKAYICI